MNDFSPETPEARMVVPAELGKTLAEAKATIGQEMDSAGSQMTQSTEQLGLLASLGGLYKDMAVKKMGIAFKDVKAALSLIPFVPLASEAIKAVKLSGEAGAASKVLKFGGEMNKVARLGSDGVAMAVHEAAYVEGQATKAQKTAKNAERWATWFKGSERAQQKFEKAATNAQRLRQEADAATTAAISSLKKGKAGLTAAEKAEGTVSRFVRKHIVHDLKASDYVLNYEKAVNSGKSLTEAEKVLTAIHGATPAKGLAEKVGKRAGKVVEHGILHSLGPIIDPTPDVPGVVVLGSFGAEMFGQVWAGLIPPIWQTIHNRYEGAKLSFETSMKAKDIILSHLGKKIDTLKSAQVAKAAEAFVPSPAKAAV